MTDGCEDFSLAQAVVSEIYASNNVIDGFSVVCALENSSSGLLSVAPLWPSVVVQSANGTRMPSI